MTGVLELALDPTAELRIWIPDSNFDFEAFRPRCSRYVMGAENERIAEIECWIDGAEDELTPLASFILPAGTTGAAALHLARTVCRRAERSVVHLAGESEVPPLFVVYLNRLSDLLFTLARLANHRAGAGDVTW